MIRQDNRNVDPGFKYLSGEPPISARASKFHKLENWKYISDKFHFVVLFNSPTTFN
jgi:hypothetical protein